MTNRDIKRKLQDRAREENIRKLEKFNTEDHEFGLLNYLARLWSPSPGQRVLNSLFEPLCVVGIPDEEYPEQVQLSTGEIAFVQDLFWYPTQDELNNLLRSFGALVSGDSVLYRKVFFALPSTLDDYCKIIGQIRFRSASFGNLPTFEG